MAAQRCVDGGELLTVSPLRGRTKEPDEACAQAVDLARAAAEEMAGLAGVGEHLSATADGDRVVTHLFRSLDPAYQGWYWAITVARASRSKHVTVSEGLLLPGSEAILAPDWVPWRERLRPGDLGPGDLLPAAPDDERLVPMATLDGDDGLTDWGESSWAVPGAELAGLATADDEDDDTAQVEYSGRGGQRGRWRHGRRPGRAGRRRRARRRRQRRTARMRRTARRHPPRGRGRGQRRPGHRAAARPGTVPHRAG